MNACAHLQDRKVLANRRPIDAAYVIHRLEEAGATLLALPGAGDSTRMRVPELDLLPETGSAPSGAMRPPVPSAERITRMDEALAWLALIPRERYVLRRILGARALVSPGTGRHLFSWRRLGGVLGADHKAVQRWHAQAVDMIVAALNPAAEMSDSALIAAFIARRGVTQCPPGLAAPTTATLTDASLAAQVDDTLSRLIDRKMPAPIGHKKPLVGWAAYWAKKKGLTNV
jgi:hypothetical protein